MYILHDPRKNYVIVVQQKAKYDDLSNSDILELVNFSKDENTKSY
jgi:hypothetical protein